MRSGNIKDFLHDQIGDSSNLVIKNGHQYGLNIDEMLGSDLQTPLNQLDKIKSRLNKADVDLQTAQKELKVANSEMKKLILNS